jgi:glutathione peroxidase-family protein
VKLDESVVPSPDIAITDRMDINGNEMHDLYKYLKRESPLFVAKKAKSERIREPFGKFLCDRYGRVRKYFPHDAGLERIIGDLDEILEGEFDAKEYEELHNPTHTYF